MIFDMEPKFPYRRVADDLRNKINSGEIAGQLPSRARLAEEYGVADMTIGRALRVLKDEGSCSGCRASGSS